MRSSYQFCLLACSETTGKIFQVHYDWYNKKYGENGFHEKLDFAEVEPVVEEFRRKFIFPMLLNAEKNEKSYPFVISVG